MRRFYVFRFSSFLAIFFLGSAVFLLCAVLGAVHAASAASAAPETPITIVLDIGHGGEDGGAVGVNGAEEKEINLAIGLCVRDHLQEAGITVKMVRETDKAVGDTALATVAERKRSDIQYRAQLVNETEHCILVSIHQNFFEQNQYSGAQMFYSANHADSAVLAECIRSSIVTQIQPENKRESKQAENSIYLLSHVQVPAVIVECGFISNPEEADLLSNAEYQKQMASAIADGVIAFCRRE